jgi:DeoD family purine-nucleoside phosphorylase
VPDTIHLHPTAPLAERVLLPGDPGRALRLAQSLLNEPKMFNHNRGLWGYTGEALADGEPLTIQATGMGGPSAAIVITELVALGARRLVRVGTCGALVSALGLGELIVATEALAGDGTSRALGAGERISGTDGLLAALAEAAATHAALDDAHGGGPAAVTGPVVSTDVFYDEREGLERQWVAAGAIAVEMEAATLYALSAKLNFESAALLLVSDLVHPERVRIDPDQLVQGELRLGAVAAQALAGAPS